MTKEQYRYILTKLRAGSDKYGNCEVCKKSVGTIYHQVEEKKYSGGWTRHNCTDLYGHKQCLLKKRR